MGIINLFDPWKSKLCTCPRKYTINPYTGCSHMCLYCYTTSYIGLRKSTPKKDIIKRLKKDLERCDPGIPIDMSLSSDPYPPEEKKYRITRKVLELLLPKGFKVQVTTKSTLILLDLDLFQKYNVAVSMTITTLDDNLARKIEPFAPVPTERLKALEEIFKAGVPFSVRIDPIIPYLNDDKEELKELVREVVSIGAKHIVTSTYKARPDNFKRMVEKFPELEHKWRKLYYPKGRVRGYAYLPMDLRKRLLSIITSEAKKLGVSYATCREGLITKEFFNAKSCDGTHLIPKRFSSKFRKTITLTDKFEK